jgi:hypothetical protein
MDAMTQSKKMTAIHAAVAAVAPIQGVGVGSFDDKGTWIVSFQEATTPQQRAAALQVIADLDVSSL